jgi:DNA-binding LacI/PurR family transcriptional regulator
MQRSDAFIRAAQRLALPEIVTLYTDFSSEEGARATRRLLADSTNSPTAIVYDNDAMAAAAVGAANKMNIPQAKSLAIIAYHDSPLCWLSNPTLTAINRRIPEHGSQSVKMLNQLLAGERPDDIRLDAPVLVPRSSTEPAHG